MPFTEEEWSEISSTQLPGTSDAIVKKLHQARISLIREEQKRRSDHAFKQSLSPLARRANDIVAKIRDHERKTVWTPQFEEHLAVSSGLTVHPGMMFHLAKSRMESTDLFRIVRKMPKGGLLHAHLDAMVDFGYLLDALMEEPGIHISAADGPLVGKKTLAEAPIQFKFLKQERGEGPEIWDEKVYERGTPIRLTKAADAFPNGGRQGFLKWLRSRCVLSTTDAVEQHHGIDAIWDKFSKCFLVTATVIHYEPMWRKFLRRLMKVLYEDGVHWTEIRFTWPLNYHRLGSETPEEDYTHMFTVLDEEIKAFQSSPEGRGFWGIRTIWTSLRALDSRSIIQDMDNCITTKIQFPHLIAGYDLVGPEDLGKPLKDFYPELLWFRQQCAAEHVELPFIFHAGETLGDGNDTDHNLVDAIMLGTRRIGHGFSLYKHPQLIDMVKEKRILIESCPISNEVLRLCASIMSHPLPALLARGVPACLCNDDPAMLGHDTAGSTHDFVQALQGWENLGLAGLGSLAENSVRWACFEDQTSEQWLKDVKEASLGSSLKAERLREWAVAWENFCVWVVDEYGDKWEHDSDKTATHSGGAAL